MIQLWPRGQVLLNLDDAVRSLHDALTMDYCPYLTHGGQCVTGCWSEPRCITEGPPPVKQAARWVQDEARFAQRHLTSHGDIKHARDIKRWAQKIEVKVL